MTFVTYLLKNFLFPDFRILSNCHFFQRITDDYVFFTDENKLFTDNAPFLSPEFYLCLEFLKIMGPHEQIKKN